MRRLGTAFGPVGLGVLAACDLLAGQPASGDAQSQPVAASDKADATQDAKAPQADSTPPAEPADDEPDGPHVAWQLQLETVPRLVTVTDGGTVITVTERGIDGFADGKRVWNKEGAYAGVHRLLDGSVVSTTGATIVAFDPSTGEDRFRVDLPTPPRRQGRGRRGEPKPPPAVMAAATFGSQLLVADQEARFFVVDPPTCAKSEPACLRPAGVLPGEVLEVGTRLTVGADATRYLVEEDTMRAFDQTLAVLFDVQATGRIVAAVPTGTEGLALAANGQVALLAVPRCTRESLHLPDIATGPKQCVRWIYGDNLDDAAPAVVDPDTLAVNGNKRIQAVVAGTDSWKSPIDSVGPVLVGSDELLYTMTVENSPTASTLSLAAVRPDRGTVAWSVPLPLPSEATGDGSADASLAEVVAPENLSLDVAGAWVAAGFDRHVTVVSVPASPPAASQG